MASVLQFLFSSTTMLEYIRLHQSCIADCSTCVWRLLRDTELKTRSSGSKLLLHSWRWWVDAHNGSFDAQQDALYNLLAILDAQPVTVVMQSKREELRATVSLTHRTYFEKCGCCETTEETKSMHAKV